MICGLLPWRADVLKKPRVKMTEEERLLRDGWQYVNMSQTLSWKDKNWRLLYKVIEDRPRHLPGFDPIDVVLVQDAYGTLLKYQYIEFMAVSHEDGHAELYAYGNFLKGKDKPYIMRGKQLIRIEHEPKSFKSYGNDQPDFNL